MHNFKSTNNVLITYDEFSYTELNYNLHPMTEKDKILFNWICSFLFL